MYLKTPVGGGKVNGEEFIFYIMLIIFLVKKWILGKKCVGEMQHNNKKKTKIPSAASKSVPRTSVLQLWSVVQVCATVVFVTHHGSWPNTLGENTDHKTTIASTTTRLVT